MIKIREPIWKLMAVGVAEDKMEDKIEVEILYKAKNGDRIFPGVFTIPKVVAMNFPVQVVKGHKLHIIPIAAFRKK